MKKCYHCGKEWSNRVENPKYCVRCGNNPHRPTLKKRIEEGWRAFVAAGKAKGYKPRTTRPKQAHMDNYINAEPNFQDTPVSLASQSVIPSDMAIAQGTDRDLTDPRD